MNPIGADGVKALGGAGFAKLSALFLLGSEIGPDGASALGKAGFKLKVLALSGNSVGDEGAKALAGSAKLSYPQHTGPERQRHRRCRCQSARRVTRT